MKFLSEEWAELAHRWKFKNLPNEVVWASKRALLDTLACILGAQNSNPAKIAIGVMGKLESAGKSTIFGADGYYPDASATLVNGIMLRYLDFLDTYSISPREGAHTGSHPSETIPAILAVGESIGASGQKILAAIVLAYQLDGIMVRAPQHNVLQVRGFHYGTHGAFVVPAALGYLLGLPIKTISHAISIGGMKGPTLDIVDRAPSLSMSKNIAFPLAASHGVQATYLAMGGFTGFLSIFEGPSGLIESVYGGDFRIPKGELVPKNKIYYIMDLLQKEVPVESTSIGLTQCTLELVLKYNIIPEEIQEIKIHCGTRNANHCGNPERRHPNNKETADHSIYFVSAASVVDKEMTPKQYEKLNDKRIYDVAEKVSVHIDTYFDEKPRREGGRVEIVMKNDKILKATRSIAHGHQNDPLTDSEIEAKFTAVAGNSLSKKIIPTIWEFDKIKNISPFMRIFAKDTPKYNKK